MTKGALDGLSVVELGSGVAAPFCAKVLGDLGAHVVKIEPPEGDPARRSGPYPGDGPDLEAGALFLYFNTSKKSVTLDLASERGRTLLGRLLLTADVFVVDRSLAALETLGLGGARLAATHPKLVVTSITPFGESGPRRDQHARHLNLYHVGGQSMFWGAPGSDHDAPPRGPGHLGEVDAGLTAAVATLAAVLGRRSTGRGRHVEISTQEAMIGLERVDVGAAANETDRRARPRLVGGLVRASDGFVVITAVQEHQWRGLVRAMGSPEWAAESWCSDETARTEHRDRIQPLIEEWAVALGRDEIYCRCQREGAPVGPVHRIDEVLAWQQARAREFFVSVTFPAAGARTIPGAPYRFSRTPVVVGAAPRLGEHNDEILRGRLDSSAAELDGALGASVAS